MIKIENMGNLIKVNVKKLRENAVLPTKGSSESAGYDLYACCEDKVTIEPHHTEKIGTGLAIQPPEGYFGAIFARSGLAAKNGLRPANCTGVCDGDFRGEYIVALHNDTDCTQTVCPGDRIAQLIFLPYLSVKFNEIVDLDKTERGSGGFGSTGR